MPSSAGSDGAGSAISEAEMKEFNKCVLTAKKRLNQGEQQEALLIYQRARKIYPSEKLDNRISKLLRALNLSTDDNLTVDTSSSSTLTVLSTGSDNKRPSPHTPIKHEEKRRSPGLESWQSEQAEMKVAEIDTDDADKENTTPTDHGAEETNTEPDGAEHDADVKDETPADDLPDDLASLLKAAKEFVGNDDVLLALRCYQKANKLEPSEKLERRIDRFKNFLTDKGIPLPDDTNSLAADTASPETIETDDPQQQEEKEMETGPSPNVETESMSYDEPELSEDSEQPSPPKEQPPTDNGMGVAQTPSSNRYNSVSTPGAQANLSEEDIAIYNSLLSQAKSLVRNGEFAEALSMYEQACLLHPSDKLKEKITKIKTYVNELQPPASPTAVTVERESTPPPPEEQNSPDDSAIEAHYNELVSRGKKLIEQEKLQEALSLYEDAYGVKPNDKLKRKMDRIQLYIEQQKKKQQAGEANTEESSHGSQQIEMKSEGESAPPVKYDKNERYNELVLRGKELISNREVKQALQVLQEAALIKSSDKLTKKIQKCKDYIEANEEDHSSEFIHVGNGFYLHQDLYSKLYPHQKESILWFWGLHKKKTGGILADDMGLGKTIQVIAFLSGLFDADEAKCVIIVMPLSLIENWKKEFEKWAPGIGVHTYHGGSARERARATAKIQRRGGVLLTSYGMIVSSAELIAKKDGESFGREFKYDYVILDEGHKIKNPTKTSKGVHLIAARHRIILTGTPIQNNLKEMWALFDWTHHGMLLGTARTFQTEYNKPITRAREKCATYGERRLGEQIADSLKRIIAPYLLRRTKAEVKEDAKKRGKEGVVTVGPEMPKLKRKNDFVVWCYLSELQQNIYRSFSEQDEIKELLNTSKSPLTSLVVLKKICDHPRLMSNNQCHKLGLFTPGELVGADVNTMKDCAANRVEAIDDEILIKESGKLRFLVQLMSQLKQEGHRTLIFSMSRKMLNIIQKVLRNRGHNVLRMDGTITDLSEREKCVRAFQDSDLYDTFLLTTQVGGVGLTLTAADRVIIFDPSWNPATDSQAVDRAFRIGQQKNVAIYRFISCGTIEEKIYRRQVFKDSVNRQTMQKDDKNLFRYFTNHELYELFQLDNPMESKTQQQLEHMHAHQRVTDTALDEHIAYLYSCHMYGLSDHDLMFSKEDEELDGDENVEYIEERVNKAMELLSREGELQSKMNEEEGKYVPGHLDKLPKPSVKPPRDWDSSGEMDPGQTERLFPEYDYENEVMIGDDREEPPSAAAGGDYNTEAIRAENDWRQHAASTPHKGAEETEVITLDDDSVHQSAHSSHYRSANQSAHHSSMANSMEQAEGMDQSHQSAAGQSLDNSGQVNSSHHRSANQSAHHTSMANNMEETEEMDQSQHSETNLSMDKSGQASISHLSPSRNTPEKSLNTSSASLNTSMAGLQFNRLSNNAEGETMDDADKVVEKSQHEKSVHDRSAAVEADFDDEDFELDDIEATENESRHHQDTSVDREEEILAGDSLNDDDENDDEIVADDSADVIEDSQSGSMLGDDFGNLHDDYTVKESDEEVSFVTSPTKAHKRRSTVFAAPTDIDDIDDNDDVSFDDEEVVADSDATVDDLELSD